MFFVRPATWSEALTARAEHPQAQVICGGTDVMVALNLTDARPSGLLDVTAVPELGRWQRRGNLIRLGAGVTYAQVLRDLAAELPGLAAASRTVGSPQIRNRGTIAGNLGTASPAGDSHPPLLALDATIELVSLRGTRQVPVREFFHAPRRNALAPDELIAAVEVPVTGGPQSYAKVGGRNAMVIAVCAFALSLDPRTRTVGTGIGSAAPTPRRAPEAEEHLAARLHDSGAWEWLERLGDGRDAGLRVDSGLELDPRAVHRFGDLVAAAAAPIDDVRGSAAYRRHGLAVLARRAVEVALAGPPQRAVAA